MNDADLVARLTPTGKPRVPLYLAPSKIEHLYLQTVTAVNELTRSTRDHDKVSANLFGFLGGEISAERNLEGRVAVSPLLQAIVLEKAASESDQLIDLASTQTRARKGPPVCRPGSLCQNGCRSGYGSRGSVRRRSPRSRSKAEDPRGNPPLSG